MTCQRGARIAVAIFVLVLACLPFASRAQTSTVSLEQQLVDAYAPIVTIKSQSTECASDGEQFRPVVVDILFGTDDVRLMQRGTGQPSTDVEIKRNLSAADLANLDASYYLDLPGNPRQPECTYEQWGKKRMAELGLEPSLYARVTSEPGQPGIVVQYWYYWIFNFFNNTHESDWEGIQLTFDAGSIEEILDRQLLPTQIAFAQHEGGEQADPDSDKVEWQGTHIVSHPSSGSHADYYESAVWLGWGENGSGFGCDYSDAPNEEPPVDIVLIPEEIDPAGPFAWLTYAGQWGQREDLSMFSGPTGPNTKPRWNEPVTWSEGVRSTSLPVPVKATIGPGISPVFCGAAELGSRLVREFPIDPKIVTGLILGVLGAFLVLAAMAWRSFASAVRLYLKHGYFFITTGVVSFPLAFLGEKIEDVLQDRLPLGADDTISRMRIGGSVFQYVFHIGMGGIQEIVLACLFGPAVIFATLEYMKSDRVTLEGSWLRGLRLFPRVLGATFLVAVLLSFMIFSVVLIPLAMYKAVQWFFTPQAVVIDGASWRNARTVSADRMKGHWWRALAVLAGIAVVSGLPGPLVGTALLVLGKVGLEQAQWISAGIYCVLYPIALIMGTVFYLRCMTAPGQVAPYVVEPVAAPASVATA